MLALYMYSCKLVNYVILVFCMFISKNKFFCQFHSTCNVLLGNGDNHIDIYVDLSFDNWLNTLLIFRFRYSYHIRNS